MATRTNTPMSVLASLVILGILALVFFVFSVMLLASNQQTSDKLDELEARFAEFVSEADTTDDRILAFSRESGSDTVVSYLATSLRGLAEDVAGNRNSTPADIQIALQNVFGKDNPGSVVSEVRVMQDRIDSLQQQLEAAEAQRSTAQASLEAEIDRSGERRARFDSTKDALNEQLDALQTEIDEYRAGVEAAREDFESRNDDLKADADAVIGDLESRNNSLLNRVIELETQLARREGTNLDISGAAEETLVDAEVLSIDAIDNTVFISRGSDDKLALGLTFEVYSDGTRLVPNDRGELPAGKATVEVISVNEQTAVARVLRSARGNPIVRGDSLVNALYDPFKTYRFVVFGNFDVDGDLFATPSELNDIRSIIGEWGGEIDEDVTGVTDFVVLGERPRLGRQPDLNAPPAIQERYARSVQNQRRYDALFEAATRASIPVLNQNRLFKLTGIRERQR